MQFIDGLIDCSSISITGDSRMLDYEENIDESNNVRVFVRILPLLKRCEDCMKIGPEKKTIYVKCLQDMKEKRIPRGKNSLYWSFKTDGIFYDCSQEEIYRETTRDIINKVLDGASCVLISSGQTGTGKSFTTSGLRNNWEHRGLIPRLVSDLFVEKKRHKSTNKIGYSLSYVEFQGKKFKDLLKPMFGSSDNSHKYDPFKGITSVSVKNEKDALQYIFRGEAQRALAERSMYPACHLGTAVISFHVHNTSLITSWAVISESVLHIVEMAGIDTPAKSGCPKNARDVIAANTMKLELEELFSSLGRCDRAASPFKRSNGLLTYLGEALRVTSIIRFIAHVRVTEEDLDVALSTLRFASKIAKINPEKITYNVKPQITMFVEKLKEEIGRLKRELDINETFFRQEAVMNVSTDRAEQIEQDFLSFLNGNISDIKLISLSQVQVLAKMMKELYAKITVEKEEAQKAAERCETALKNATRMTSKTSVPGSAKGTSRKSSTLKDRVSMTSGEVAEVIHAEKVGTLEDPGITLGPGLTGIPAISAVRALTKSSRPESKESNEDLMTQELKNKNSEATVRKTFETMQHMLKRLTVNERTPKSAIVRTKNH